MDGRPFSPTPQPAGGCWPDAVAQARAIVQTSYVDTGDPCAQRALALALTAVERALDMGATASTPRARP